MPCAALYKSADLITAWYTCLAFVIVVINIITKVKAFALVLASIKEKT
jgi:hypothetical protein